MSEALSTTRPSRRWLLATMAALLVVTVAVFAGYYAVRRAEVETARRHYDIALRFHDAGAISNQYLYEVSAQILEAQRRVPFASFDQAAAEHVARIDALRDKYIAQLPGINQKVSQLETLGELISEAREWQRSGKRPADDD